MAARSDPDLAAGTFRAAPSEHLADASVTSPRVVTSDALLRGESQLAILHERRGTMYDPLIVDTFAKMHATLHKEPDNPRPAPEVLNTIAHSRRASVVTEAAIATPDEIAASGDEMLSVYELARALAGQVSISDVGDIIAKHLQRIIPSSLCVFYLYDRSSDILEARHAVGEGTLHVRGMQVGLGQRLSGWVAANRQTIANSMCSWPSNG